MSEHRLACLLDRFDRDQAEVEQPVVVGAQHGDVLQHVSAAVFSSDDMRNVARCFAPAADRTAVIELAPDGAPEAFRSCVDTVGRSAPDHGLRVPDAEAFPGAVDVSVRVLAGAFLRWQVLDRFSAGGARFRLAGYAFARWVVLLPGKLAMIRAEFRLLSKKTPFTPGDRLSAGEAHFRRIAVTGRVPALVAAPGCTGTSFDSRAPGDRIAAAYTRLTGNVLRITVRSASLAAKSSFSTRFGTVSPRDRLVARSTSLAKDGVWMPGSPSHGLSIQGQAKTGSRMAGDTSHYLSIQGEHRG